MRKSITSAMLAIVSFSSIPTKALAKPDYPDSATYASQQCDNNRWADLAYPSYEQCYYAALAYYDYQVSGGSDGSGLPGSDEPIGGGGGSGGGGGGMFLIDLPGYNPFGDNCTAKSRLCNDG